MQELDLTGKSLGQYQILEELGQGGMAVVYKAWQASLRRYVAIKVMLPHLLTDREFVQRFQQEAIVAANLNHSNIVTIYEVAQHEGYFFIVMEYVEGQSLEQLVVSEGALSLERSVHILRQVADALDFAHQRQFIHRDIKPANILLTPEKKAVISDFGIAKALKGSGATANLTTTGTIIGSPAYMSPEQIIGQEVDYRTDLYSIGVVAYEMFSGRAPFSGATTAILYAQVNTPPPNIGEIQPNLPPHVGIALSRMLAKQPSERYSTASAFVEVLAGQQQPSVGPVPPLQRTSVMPPGAADPYAQQRKMAGINTGEYPPAGGAQSGASSPNHFPDGSKSVVPPSEAGPASNRKSPWIWWLVGGGGLLLLLAVIGIFVFWVGPSIFDNWPIGQAEAVSEERNEEIAVSPVVDRTRVAFVSDRDGNPEIYIMNSDGSGQYNLSNSPSADYWPHWSPDSTKIVFHAYEASDTDRENADIYLMNADGTDWNRLTRSVASEKFPSWAPDGRRIVFVSNQTGDYEIYTMKDDGSDVIQVTNNPAKDYFPSWSPDGNHILFESDREGNVDIYRMDRDGSNIIRLTDSDATDTGASWSPNGDYIAFGSDRSGQREIWIMSRDGSSLVQLTDYGAHQPGWSPDSKRLLFVSKYQSEYENIFIMDNDGKNLVQLTTASAHDVNPSWEGR